MYGGIVVHSKYERRPAKEFYIVFGEVYNTADKGLFTDIAHTNTTTTAIANSTSDKSVLQKKRAEQEIGSFDVNF